MAATGLNVVLSGYYSSVDVWAHQRFTAEQRAHAERVLQQLGIAALKDKLYATLDTMVPKGQPKSAATPKKKTMAKKSVAQK